MNNTETQIETLAPINHQYILTDILYRLLDVQNKGLAHVWFEISGHVSQLDVHVCAPKWIENVNYSYTDRVYLDHTDTEKLKSFKTNLYKYLDSL